jgi:hypothetical protein
LVGIAAYIFRQEITDDTLMHCEARLEGTMAGQEGVEKASTIEIVGQESAALSPT